MEYGPSCAYQYKRALMGMDWRGTEFPLPHIATPCHRQPLKSWHSAKVPGDLEDWEHPRYFGCLARFQKQQQNWRENLHPQESFQLNLTQIKSPERTCRVQHISSLNDSKNELDKLLRAVKTFLRQTFYRTVLCAGHSSRPALSGYPARSINELIRITGGLG